MKKIALTFFLGLFFCFSLTACDPGYFYYKDRASDTDIVGVELINYNNPDAKEINTFLPGSFKQILPFDFDKMEVLETLDASMLDDFLNDLGELYIWTIWDQLDSPNGICIRLIFGNGDFEIICYDDFFIRYDSQGNYKAYIGEVERREDYVNLVNQHFTTQIA